MQNSNNSNNTSNINNTNIENTCFLDALNFSNHSRTPVWLMRQAGRYLPEYRATRATAGSFMQLAKNPEFATEVTLQPLARFDLDASILFSDILTIPDAMGLGLDFVQGEGPVFANPLQHETQIQAIENIKLDDLMGELSYVFKAVTSIKNALKNPETGMQKLPLIGFSGSPWTLACYMVEGHGSHNDFMIAKKMLYQRPDLMQKIIDINTKAIIAYLDLQIQAGANAVMIFDSWGGLLPAKLFQKYSLSSIEQILEKLNILHPNTPKIVFCKGIGLGLAQLNKLNCNGLGIDWVTDLASARQTIQAPKALQGNLDPMQLLGTPENIQTRVHEMLAAYTKSHGSLQGYIANLGHGILQQTPPEHVGVMIDAIRAFKI